MLTPYISLGPPNSDVRPFLSIFKTKAFVFRLSDQKFESSIIFDEEVKEKDFYWVDNYIYQDTESSNSMLWNI